MMRIRHIFLNRYLPLSSHHFLVQCDLKQGEQIQKIRKSDEKSRRDYKVLHSDDKRSDFARDFVARMHKCTATMNVNQRLLQINDAMHYAKE